MPLVSNNADVVDFNAMRLSAETPIQLWRKTLSNAEYYPSVVYGYARDRFLIVRLPTSRLLNVQFDEAEPLEVRLFTGLSAFTFETAVQRVFRAPLSYLHLDFPSTVRRLPIRKSSRVALELPALVRHGDGPMQPGATIVNLSTTGAMLRTPDGMHCEAGQPVTIRLMLPGEVEGLEESPVECRAIVRNTKPAQAGLDGRVLGIEFDAPAPGDVLRIKLLLYQQRFGRI